jgi:hypothetical protein
MAASVNNSNRCQQLSGHVAADQLRRVIGLVGCSYDSSTATASCHASHSNSINSNAQLAAAAMLAALTLWPGAPLTPSLARVLLRTSATSWVPAGKQRRHGHGLTLALTTCTLHLPLDHGNQRLGFKPYGKHGNNPHSGAVTSTVLAAVAP